VYFLRVRNIIFKHSYHLDKPQAGFKVLGVLHKCIYFCVGVKSSPHHENISMSSAAVIIQEQRPGFAKNVSRISCCCKLKMFGRRTP
jgi:hypothetical protein